MRSAILRFDNTVERDPAITAWLNQHNDQLGALARLWFAKMRDYGDEVREIFHDGAANACLGDAPFAYVAIFTAHVNVGFFHGNALPDPQRLLLGSGKFMRHVKLKPGTDTSALQTLIEAAYADIQTRL